MTQSKATTPCPKCGKAFACCVEKGGQCWCASVKLSPNDRSYLASQFDVCLCPDCLKVLVTGVLLGDE